MKREGKGINLLLGAILPGLILWMICPLPAGSDELSAWRNVTNQELDEIRGGYITDRGLPITFGYNETTTINGVTVVNKTFNFPGNLPSSLKDLSTLIQNGTGNDFSPNSISKDLWLTVIQNSRDQQVISHQTTIDISLTNVNLFRNMNLSSSLTQGMIRGMR